MDLFVCPLTKGEGGKKTKSVTKGKWNRVEIVPRLFACIEWSAIERGGKLTAFFSSDLERKKGLHQWKESEKEKK